MSGLAGQQLPAVVVAYGDIVEPTLHGKLDQFRCGVEVAEAGDRLWCCGCPAQLRPGRVDRDASAGAEYALAFAKHTNRVLEEEEDHRHGHSCERIVRER